MGFWDSPGKNTGVVSHSLLQGIFLTEGLNPGLLHYRHIIYHLSQQGSPWYIINTPKGFHTHVTALSSPFLQQVEFLIWSLGDFVQNSWLPWPLSEVSVSRTQPLTSSHSPCMPFMWIVFIPVASTVICVAGTLDPQLWCMVLPVFRHQYVLCTNPLPFLIGYPISLFIKLPVQFSSTFTAYVWQGSTVVVEDTEVPFYLSEYSSN